MYHRPPPAATKAGEKRGQGIEITGLEFSALPGLKIDKITV